MKNIFDINSINLCIGGIISTLSVVLFMIPIPQTERWKNFKSGRSTLVIAYAVLGILMIVNGIVGADDSIISGMITLIVAFFQALLFTRICILFLKPRSFGGKIYKSLLLASGIFSIALAAGYIINMTVFIRMFWIGVGLYAALLAFCCIVFVRNYNETLQRLEYVYDEDMYYSVSWVKGCFISALIIGLIALSMAVFRSSQTLNIIGIFIYTVYYLIMVGYFIQYVTNYNFLMKSDDYLPPPNTVPEKVKASHLSANEDKHIAEKLEKWVEMKRYRDRGRTMDEIVHELDTTRLELNEYMNSHYNTNFRAWRNSLRIEEAKRLLIETSLPAASIPGAVGYTDRSNFHRHFTESTGMTPSQYRAKFRE